MEQLNGKEFNSRELYVARAQKKAERQAELREKFERYKASLMGRCHGVNLYVKNLDDSMDDEALKNEFIKFGEISSVKVKHIISNIEIQRTNDEYECRL